MKYSTFVLMLLSMFVAFAVDKVDYHVPRDYSVIPPSPEASKLFEYNEISVNNNMGIPDISFNLFEITEGNISIPLVLAYSGGGISREEMEGNAGLGWNVTCGSNITRVVYGAPDETYRGNGIHGLFKLNFEENEFRRKLIEQVPFNPNDRRFFVNHLMWMVEKGQRYIEGRSDLANDIFHISGLGMSGTFIYNDNRDIVLSTNSSIVISPSKCMNSYPNDFEVKDNIGNKYVFNERELTRYDYFYGSPFLKQMEDSVIYTSAWHVSSITNLLGQQVRFLYEQSDGYEWRSTQYESVAQLTNVDLDIYTPRNVASLSTVRYMPKVIKSISTPSIDVVFEYEKMQIGRFKKQVIKAIKVFRKGIVEPARTFSFEYTLMDDPFNNVNNNEFWGRNIMLSSVRDNGRLVYEFNYYSDEQHEFANTPFSADFGGGYNGKDNVSLVPSYKQYYGWGADRSVNPKSAFIGSLKDIKYPSGDYIREYDSDGRLVSDGTRGIESITYHRWGNLPRMFKLSNGNSSISEYMSNGWLKSRNFTTKKLYTVTKVDPVTKDTVKTEILRPYSENHEYVGNFERIGSKWRLHTPSGYYDLSEGKLYHYVKDRLGSVVAVVDNDGHTQQLTAYYPSGIPYDVFGFGKVTDRLHIGNRWMSLGMNTYDNTARFHYPLIPSFDTPDPCLDKYPDLSPYSYCAGNPLRYVDRNGEFIVMVDKYNTTNQLYYNIDKQNFVDINGDVYKGNDTFVTQVRDDLNTLCSQKNGLDLVTAIVNSEKGVRINRSLKSNDSNFEDQVSYDLVENVVSGISFNEESQAPDGKSYTALAHELVHSYERMNGTLNLDSWVTIDGNNVTQAEKFATFIENKVRAEHGLSLRTHYETGSESTRILDKDNRSLYFDTDGNHNAEYKQVEDNKRFVFSK